MLTSETCELHRHQVWVGRGRHMPINCSAILPQGILWNEGKPLH